MSVPESLNGSVEHLAAYHQQKESQHQNVIQKLQEREHDLLARCMLQKNQQPLDAQVPLSMTSP